jgi:hypothetical protein
VKVRVGGVVETRSGESWGMRVLSPSYLLVFKAWWECSYGDGD